MNNKTGILLVNLGTPNSPNTPDVRAYLKQFLYDSRVIELPSFLRWILVNLIIVPFRASKSAAAYAQIWQNTGSPLMTNSIALQKKLAELLGADYCVELGMTYGTPSINSALQQLEQKKVQKIIVLPLFPQYSSAATGAPLEQVLALIAKYKVIPEIKVISQFYQHPDFIAALAASIQPYVNLECDYILMSYHGLPEQQMVHSDSAVACDLRGECPAINSANANCYRAQCYQTSRLIAQQLNLPATKWGIGFQSRLGRLPWIRPYTDELLVNLRQQGINKLVICCPSFVADCLETLEEIGIRAKEQWHSLGGTSLTLVPCLNAQPIWVTAVAKIILG